MGTFFHPITIAGPNGEETVDALVDPASLFAILPKDVLKRTGSEPLGSRQYRKPHDSVIERNYGQVRGRLEGHDGYFMVVYGEEGDPVRIGEHTLTSFLLEADLDQERLVDKVFRMVEHLS